jgi:hypothetical protein
MASEQLVNESVNIRRARDSRVISHSLFWCHVTGRPQHVHAASDTAFCLQQARQTKIGQVRFSSCSGAVIGLALLVALYVAGGSRSPIFGHGQGQLAAVAFLGISLVVAGVRAVPGCELMAIPGAFFRNDTELACLIFSPLDSLERKLRTKHDG